MVYLSRIPRFVPYNAKIADITETDTSTHTLDLETALSETRKIVGVLLGSLRVSGTGDLRAYANEGSRNTSLGIYGTGCELIVIAEGTQRLQYSLTVANDDYDLYCLGYVVEA